MANPNQGVETADTSRFIPFTTAVASDIWDADAVLCGMSARLMEMGINDDLRVELERMLRVVSRILNSCASDLANAADPVVIAERSND